MIMLGLTLLCLVSGHQGNVPFLMYVSLILSHTPIINHPLKSAIGEMRRIKDANMVKGYVMLSMPLLYH